MEKTKYLVCQKMQVVFPAQRNHSFLIVKIAQIAKMKIQFLVTRNYLYDWEYFQKKDSDINSIMIGNWSLVNLSEGTEI